VNPEKKVLSCSKYSARRVSRSWPCLRGSLCLSEADSERAQPLCHHGLVVSQLKLRF